MAGKCGGLSNSKEATPEIQEIIIKIKPSAEEKAGKSFDVFEAKHFASQVVAGVNYFVKVHVGNSDHLHLRIYKNLQGELSLHSLQEGKEESDPIEYF